ncbi:hypothetical protein AB0I28_33075 [Phytomonospora sp. NPDC050363]|uniref:hypothetical protein n=1 Tax=Phytomonospora sp. NPDC050363 TaxID=3155642 RepID=UPI0033C9936A
MLTRPARARLLVSITAGFLAASALLAAPAAADYVYCPPDGGECYIVIEDPGTPGGGGDNPGGGGGNPACSWQSKPVDCKKGGAWFDGTSGCYYELMDPQPPAGDPMWMGHDPNAGDIYWRGQCLPGALKTPNFPEFRTTPPPGYGGGMTPAQLAARAVAMLPIDGPDIHTAPDTGGEGLVGLPVWMWTPTTISTWGPAEATAAIPGMSVTARATATRIVWSMGDGTQVTCNNPGTAYRGSYGHKKSPTCGHVYQEADENYTVTATTTWSIEWWVVGGGETGTLSTTRDSTTTLTIEEAQVVTG